MKKIISIVSILAIITSNSFGQSKFKWGKISKEEKELTEVSYDKDASAVILNSEGNLSFSSGFVNIKKHYRIKILKEQGIKYANIKIPYYFNTSNITGLKAQIINFDENGKEIITKLESDDFFETKLDAEFKEISFTFPDVKVGSIIEYKYTYNSSNLIFINGWIFQDVIPTLHSKLSSSFPSAEIMSYGVYYQGDKLIKKYNQTPSDTWELSDLKGLKDDKYVYSILDYAELIQFQLSEYKEKSGSYALDGSYVFKKFAPSWDEFAKTILKHSGIANYINNSNKTSDLLTNLYTDDASKTDKITSIYTYVSTNYAWNGEYSKYTDNNLNKLLEEKSGNSCEINMLLLAMLKEADYEVYPVLISTKSHGRVSTGFPIIAEYNHFIVALKIGKTYQLLDALNPYRPYNLLSVEDLNNYGFIVDENDYEWINIEIPTTTKQIINASIDLSQPDIQTFQFEIEYDGYFALMQRMNFNADSTKIFDELILNSSYYEIDSLNIENFEDLNKSLKIRLNFHKNSNDIYDKDIAYVDPYLIVKNSENPFKQDNRVLPIDLGYTFTENYTARIYYPENYILDEMPEKSNIELFENVCEYKFSTYNIDNYVKVESKLTIDETIFFPNEYKDLKEFYSEIISKLNGQIVLKKKQ